MKNLVFFLASIFFMSFTALGQKTTADDAGLKCVPTKECAEKMGMTLEECMALCKKMESKSQGHKAESFTSLDGQDRLTSATSGNKSCDIAKCARNAGISVEAYIRTYCSNSTTGSDHQDRADNSSDGRVEHSPPPGSSVKNIRS